MKHKLINTKLYVFGRCWKGFTVHVGKIFDIVTFERGKVSLLHNLFESESWRKIF